MVEYYTVMKKACEVQDRLSSQEGIQVNITAAVWHAIASGDGPEHILTMLEDIR